MKKLVILLSVAMIMAFSSIAVAGTITFEGMPDVYHYGYGNQNFGNYWQGVFFGPDSTVLDKNYPNSYYNYGGYPPKSGDAVLFTISTPRIDAIFDVPVDSVSMWYTSYSNFYLDAYDVNGALLRTVMGGSNINTNSYIEIVFQSDIIKKLVMHDTGNYFTIDDFTADIVTGGPSQTPEPTTLFLLGLGVLGLAGLRKRD